MAAQKKVLLPPHIYWARLGKGYLLTNDSGAHARLTPAQFRRYAATGALAPSPALDALLEGGFIRDRLDLEDQAAKRASSNEYLSRGPGLHIMVLTLRCNHRCLYCQAGAAGAAARGTDMRVSTVRRTVDFILKSPEPGLTVEFQGGEPLLNWPALKEAVLYGGKKAAAAGKDLKFALVSNFSLMTEEKAAFLVKHNVALCTSLDGPADLHDRNRALAGGGSHAATVNWIKYFQKKCGPDSDCGPSALLTVTRHSLGREKEIIAEYARLGLSSVFIRPLSPMGFAGTRWGEIGYGAAEFAAFYRNSLACLMALNAKGTFLKEKTAFFILKKVLGFRDNRYVDLRCPCGAGLGQLAYNYNGDVYTCDEGRMLGWEGDALFRTGSVLDGYRSVITSGAVRACAAASSLDSQPSCARCVWRPYCGVCPAYNYRAQGSLWGSMPANERCLTLKGIYSTVFELLGDPGKAAFLTKWLEAENNT